MIRTLLLTENPDLATCTRLCCPKRMCSVWTEWVHGCDELVVLQRSVVKYDFHRRHKVS